jgi:hypothetical protein
MSSSVGPGTPAEGSKTRLVQYSQQTRFVAGKNFFQNENQWIDSAIQKHPDAKRRRIQFGSVEYFDLAGRHQHALPWLALVLTGSALALGGVMAVVAFGRAWLLGVGTDVGEVVALTILAICLWSATVAAALPLLLKALRIDPAVVSAPLITTLVDGTGLIIYFTIARILLSL